MPYCLYVRKSRADAEAEARGEGETLSRHITALLDLAKRRKLDVTQIHKEIVSGETIAARPVMQQLLSEVEQGVWNGVLVMEVERLARGDTIDQGIVAQAFKFSGTKIITPLKDYDPNNEFDEEYFEFGLFMSRREYKTINRRLQRGRIASVMEGKYVGNFPPYGYEKVKIKGDKGFTLSAVPEQADVVKMIFELYTVGEKQSDGTYRRIGVSLIARKLNELKIPPARGDHWMPVAVRDLINNPVYAGKIRWNWRKTVKKMNGGQVEATRPRTPAEDVIIVKGLHEAIIDEETFSKAQEYMRENRPNPISPSRAVMNPLSGIVVCALCGRKMVRRPYQSGYPDTLICYDPQCRNVSSFLSSVEKSVLNSLREWLEDYKVKIQSGKEDKSAVSISVKEKALTRLEAERDTLNKQLDSTHDLLEQGIYTTDQFLDRSRKLSERINENKAERAALASDIEQDREREQGRYQIIPKIENLLNTYDYLPTARDKNEMLKEVLDKVVYLKTSGSRWHTTHDNFELTLYPKIPKYK